MARVKVGSAAHQFFKRRGYHIGESSEPDSEQSDVSAEEDEQVPEDVVEAPAGRDDDGSDGEADPERPHPVRSNKATWFEYLSKIKPDHGLDLATVKRDELVAAANEVQGITAE